MSGHTEDAYEEARAAKLKIATLYRRPETQGELGV